MPEKKKTLKLPTGAPTELTVTQCAKKRWSNEAEAFADQLAQSEWRAFNSRPRSEGRGYMVVLRWYGRERTWVPLYLDCGQVSSRLTKLCNDREATPICKYLSSFPRTQRTQLWIKWVLTETKGQARTENGFDFKEVLRAFSAKYNQGELLPFNQDADSDAVPENFSLLDY